MANLVQAATEQGPVYFDVEVIPVGPERVSRRGANIIAELDQRLDSALASARPAAQAVVTAFQGLSPNEITVEFGIRLDAEAGAVIAKTGISGHFTVSLKWSRKEEPTEGVEGVTLDTATGASVQHGADRDVRIDE